MRTLRPLLLGTLGALFAHAALAEPAGRVLSLLGDVTVSRAGKNIKLTQGANIEAGDRLVVGDKSSVQIRFTDESIVSLRPNSEFKIEDYQFKRNVETDRSTFNLVKGGLRTITGAIGKGNQQNYGVKTSTATIGIRGTHYVLVSCLNSCFNPDGSLAPNGLFGGVTDGRIAVTNDNGSMEFGQQEFFHVASASEPPRRLIAPPRFLNGQTIPSLAGKTGNGPATPLNSATQDSGTSAQISTSPSATDLTSPSPSLPSSVTQYSVNGQPALSSGTGLIALVQASGYGFPNSNGTSTNVTSDQTTSAEFAAAGYSNITTPASLASALQSQGTTVGYNASAGIYWAYEQPDASDGAGHFGWHSGWGDPVTNMPTSGIASYAYVGGTSPTDSLGRTGTFTGSTLSVNFSTQQITNLSAMQMNFTGGPGATTITFAANQTWSIGSQTNQPIAATCSAGCTISYASTNGQFTGNGASGLAASIAVAGTVSAQAYAAGTVAVFAKQ